MHKPKDLAHINENRAKDFQHSYSNSDKLQIWYLILKVGIASHTTNLILGQRKKKKKTSNIIELSH